MIDLHVMLQKPKRGYRKCPFCGCCQHTNLFKCGCGYNWLADKKTNQGNQQTQTNTSKVQSDLSLNSHTKYCRCGKVIGKNTLRCKGCNYQHHPPKRKSKSRRTRVETVRTKQRSSEKEILINYCYRFIDTDPDNILMVECPSGKPPYELRSCKPNLVSKWCQKTVDFGLKRGILYLPKALLTFFAQSKYLKNSEKREQAKVLINEWCSLGTCSEIVENRKRSKRRNR